MENHPVASDALILPDPVPEGESAAIVDAEQGIVINSLDLAQAQPRGRPHASIASLRWWWSALPNASARIGALLLILVLAVAVGAPLIAPHDPTHAAPAESFAPPWGITYGTLSGTTDHLLGTDALGRDLLSRIIFGLRTSLIIGIASVVLAVAIGLAVGLAAGYYGGWIDVVLMRLTDVQMAFPFIILAVAVLSVTEPTLPLLIVVLSLSTWPAYARVLRAIVLLEKNMDYITAARAQGANNLRIIVRYILRNIFLSIMVFATLDLATLIILEALLSFLGIGIQPPTPSLGNIMADGRNYLVNYWWIATLPGIAILLILVPLNLLGDGLQSQLDPRLRRP